MTAVDISPTVVSQARTFAAEQAPDVAGRISWVVADLTAWEPSRPYDLVVSQYVHPGIPFSEFVARLAESVAPGGTLFVAGHDHADSHSAAHAPEAASVGADAVVASLSADLWQVDVAETRTRRVRRGDTQAHDARPRGQGAPQRGLNPLPPYRAPPMIAAMATTRRADMFTADGKPRRRPA